MGRRVATLIACSAALMLAGCDPAGFQHFAPIDYLPALSGDYFPLDSQATGHRYHIYVRLPQGYDSAAEEPYPVVYLLDGDSLFPILAASHGFLAYDDNLPEAIVVGIAYGSFAPATNRREIDFGKGAAEFQDFLGKELIPRIEGRFRADPKRRILVGQSFGGSFVLYSGYTRPDLFWARIASNPSFRMHQQLFAGNPSTGDRGDLRFLLISGTANNPQGRQSALELAKRFRGQPLPWRFEEIDIQNGTHAADIGNAYRVAMRRLFLNPN